MLASLLGIRLLLWIGKTVPRPASPELLQAIREIEVTQNADGDDGFSITVGLTKEKLGEFDFLRNGALDPDHRVIVGVIMGAMPEPLIDGVIYHHQLTPGEQPGSATLKVMGRDVRVMLDLKEVNRPFKNQPDSVIVTQLLARYPQFGLVPQVTTTPNVPIELQLVPRQYETDLHFIQRLARRNGFVFYVEPLTIGANTAYWGPQQRVGKPQAALSHNLGAASNVLELSVANDALAAEGAEGTFTEPITKQSIAIPPLPDLRLPPLASRLGGPRRTRLMRGTARRNPAQAGTDLVARLTNAPDGVECTGRLDSVRYGHVLRARRLVGLRGVGLSYNGFYKVSRVRHVITRSSYTQEFALKREGAGTTTPVVPPV